MGLHSPQSAIMNAVIFNALIIVALIPLALKGVKYRPLGAAALLRRNLLIYGLGGLILPFVGIKVIDVVLVALEPRLGDRHETRPHRSLRMAVVTLVVTGVVYPLAVRGVGAVVFPKQAAGSLVTDAGRPVVARGSSVSASRPTSTSTRGRPRQAKTATTRWPRARNLGPRAALVAAVDERVAEVVRERPAPRRAMCRSTW